MIVYFAKPGFGFTIDVYFRTWGRPLRCKLKVVPYGDLPGRTSLPAGTYVFSDLERLTPAETALAAELHGQLTAQVGAERVLNDPQKTLRRYGLLTTLAEHGINHFRVHRLSETFALPPTAAFLRDEVEHVGPLSPVLHSRPELERAVARAFWYGHDARNLLLVEFCDTRCDDGLYRKYSAFVIGDRIVPREVEFSRRWQQKDTDLIDPQLNGEERSYLEQNPHEETLREIARVARVDYGRFDYGLLDGHPQVWEINTNPIVMKTPGEYEPSHLENQRWFAQRIGRAFEELDGGGSASEVPIRVAYPRGTHRHRVRALHARAGEAAHWRSGGRAGPALRMAEAILLRVPQPAAWVMRRRLRSG